MCRHGVNSWNRMFDSCTIWLLTYISASNLKLVLYWSNAYQWSYPPTFTSLFKSTIAYDSLFFLPSTNLYGNSEAEVGGKNGWTQISCGLLEFLSSFQGTIVQTTPLNPPPLSLCMFFCIKTKYNKLWESVKNHKALLWTLDTKYCFSSLPTPFCTLYYWKPSKLFGNKSQNSWFILQIAANGAQSSGPVMKFTG